MNLSAVIDTAIGLMLMYLVLSLFCTTINEIIANWLKLRAKTLKGALEKLIDNDQLRTLFYNHGLIDGAKVAATAGKTAEQQAVTVRKVPQSDPNALRREVVSPADDRRPSPHPSYFAGKDVAMALIDSVVYLHKTEAGAIPSFADVQNAIKVLPDSNIRDALITSLAQAQYDITKLRDALASWFDSSMDRLSGAYKRNLKLISLLVGLGLAAIFNADTLRVAQALWADTALSSAVSQSAASFSATNPLQKTCDQANPADAIDCERKTISTFDDALRPLPIGWTAALMPEAFWGWVLKIIGIAMTAVALTLGAPFWFDLLTQFVNLRGTGEKPKSSTSS